MSNWIAGIDVHKRMLAVVVADVAAEGEYAFEQRVVGTSPAPLRALEPSKLALHTTIQRIDAQRHESGEAAKWEHDLAEPRRTCNRATKRTTS